VVGGPYIDYSYRILLLTVCTNLANFYITKMAGLFILWSREIARKSGFNIKDLPVKYKDLSFTIGLSVYKPH